MVTALYIVSWEGSAGKTALCAGIAARLRDEGFKVSYLKPVSTKAAAVDGRPVDPDAELMRSLLKLDQTADSLTPCLIGQSAPSPARGDECRQNIRAAFARATGDVVLVEGPRNIADGSELDLAPTAVADLLDAKVVVVADYGPGLGPGQPVAP